MPKPDFEITFHYQLVSPFTGSKTGWGFIREPYATLAEARASRDQYNSLGIGKSALVAKMARVTRSDTGQSVIIDGRTQAPLYVIKGGGLDDPRGQFYGSSNRRKNANRTATTYASAVALAKEILRAGDKEQALLSDFMALLGVDSVSRLKTAIVAQGFWIVGQDRYGLVHLCPKITRKLYKEVQAKLNEASLAH